MKSKKSNSLDRWSKSETKHLPWTIVLPNIYKIIKIYNIRQIKIATTLRFFYIFEHIKLVCCRHDPCFKNDLYTIAGFEYINTPARTSISARWAPAPVAQWIEQWIPKPRFFKFKNVIITTSWFYSTFSINFWFRLEPFGNIWPWRAQFGHSSLYRWPSPTLTPPESNFDNH